MLTVMLKYRRPILDGIIFIHSELALQATSQAVII